MYGAANYLNNPQGVTLFKIIIKRNQSGAQTNYGFFVNLKKILNLRYRILQASFHNLYIFGKSIMQL